MAMTEEEAKKRIEGIKSAVKDLPVNKKVQGEDVRPAIAELMSQWHKEIEAGYTIDPPGSGSVSPELAVKARVGRSPKASASEFVGIGTYTNVEQLDLLLKTIELSFVAPQLMASKLLNTVEGFVSSDEYTDSKPLSVNLTVEAGIGEALNVHVDRKTVEKYAGVTHTLTDLLKKLWEEEVVDERPPTTRDRLI